MRLAGALLFVTSTVLAEPAEPIREVAATEPAFTFEWQAPAGCPTQRDVLSRAERLVGHPLSRTSGGLPLVLMSKVQSPTAASWQLRVTSGAADAGARTVSATSCDELGDAMALLIALSLDPAYAARAAGSSGGPPRAAFSDIPASPPPASPPPPASLPPTLPPPQEAAPPVPRVAPARQPLASSRSERLYHGTVSGLGAVWLGRLPGVAPGGVLRGSLVRSPLVLGLELGFFPAQHVEAHGVGGDLWLGTLGGSLGYALFDGLLTPYAGLELDLLRGIGRGVSAPSSGGLWLLGLDAGMQFRYPVRHSLSLLAAGVLSFLPEQGRFRIDPDVELFRPARLGAQFGLGAELTIR